MENKAKKEYSSDKQEKTLAKRLEAIEEFLSDEQREEIEHLLTEAAGNLLHDIDDCTHHTDEDIVKIVQAFPGALLIEDAESDIPIQNAAWFSISSLPLLAELGVRYNIGDKGGLLAVDCLSRTVLDTIVDFDNDHCSDSDRVETLKSLHQKGLLSREDIDMILPSATEYDLVFNYLVDLNPDVLKTYRNRHGDNLFMASFCFEFDFHEDDQFERLLRAAFKHFPDDFGLLFTECYDGMTLCEYAYGCYKAVNAWKAVKRCIDETFVNRQTIEKQDPDTNLFPFMLAASLAGDRSGAVGLSESDQYFDATGSHLDIIYYLLRLKPDVTTIFILDSSEPSGLRVHSEDISVSSFQSTARCSQGRSKKMKICTSLRG